MANSPGSGSGPLRNWTMGSYDAKTGRPTESVPGSTTHGGADKQMPSIKGRDKSGSGDPGRNRYGGSRNNQ